MNGKGSHESDDSLVEEIEALQAIFSSELEITYSESGRPDMVTTTLYPATADEVSQKYVQLTVKICLPPEYPNVIPDIMFHKPRGLSEDFLQEALRNCRQRCEEFIGSPMIYEITELLRESLTNSNRPTGNCAICLYRFVPEDVFTYTPCYHHYHSHCLLRYVMNVYKQWEEESQQEAETAQAHICAKKERQLQCPVCREPIAVDLDLLRKAPAPLAAREEERFQQGQEFCTWQKQMEKIYEKQKAQGGIIDCHEEESRFLIVTDPCPSDDTPQEPPSDLSVTQQQHTVEPEIKVQQQQKPKQSHRAPSAQSSSSNTQRNVRGSHRGFSNGRGYYHRHRDNYQPQYDRPNGSFQPRHDRPNRNFQRDVRPNGSFQPMHEKQNGSFQPRSCNPAPASSDVVEEVSEKLSTI